MWTPTYRLLATIAGVVLLILVVLWFTGRLSSLLSAEQEARTARGQQGAAIESGAEAGNTLSNVAAGDARVDQTVKGGIDEIRSQPAGRSNDAAVRAACRLRVHFNSERCARLRAADSAAAAAGR